MQSLHLPFSETVLWLVSVKEFSSLNTCTWRRRRDRNFHLAFTSLPCSPPGMGSYGALRRKQRWLYRWILRVTSQACLGMLWELTAGNSDPSLWAVGTAGKWLRKNEYPVSTQRSEALNPTVDLSEESSKLWSWELHHRWVNLYNPAYLTPFRCSS